MSLCGSNHIHAELDGLTYCENVNQEYFNLMPMRIYTQTKVGTHYTVSSVCSNSSLGSEKQKREASLVSN